MINIEEEQILILRPQADGFYKKFWNKPIKILKVDEPNGLVLGLSLIHDQKFNCFYDRFITPERTLWIC